MTRSQRISLQAELWPNAARAQGWPPLDRAKRLEVLGGILGRPLATANDIVENADFTRVKNALLDLTHPERIAQKPRAVSSAESIRRHKIHQQINCLALYLPTSPSPDRGYGGQQGLAASATTATAPTPTLLTAATHYARALIRDTTARAGFEPAAFEQAPFDSLLAALTVPQLTNLIRTLDRILHNKRTGLRVKAGHTLHDMFTLAGVDCPCAQCHPANPF